MRAEEKGETQRKKETGQIRQTEQAEETEQKGQKEQILRKRTEENAYVKLLGLELLELREGYALGRIPYRQQLVNPYGSVHGGCLYSLADIVAGNAACMSGYYATTVSGALNYLRPAVSTEYITCEAVSLRVGSHLAVFEVKLTDDGGKLLDSGEFSFFLLNQKV